MTFPTLLLLSQAHAQSAPIPDFAPPTPEVWYAQVTHVTETLGTTLLPMISDRFSAAEEEPLTEVEKELYRLRRELQRTRVKRQLLAQQIAELDLALTDLASQRDLLQTQHTSARAALPDLDRVVEEREENLHHALATLDAALADDPKAQKRISPLLQDWLGYRAGLDWQRALTTMGALEPLHEQERALEELGNEYTAPTREALYNVLIAARHEEDARRDLQDRQMALAHSPVAEIDRQIDGVKHKREVAAAAYAEAGLEVQDLGRDLAETLAKDETQTLADQKSTETLRKLETWNDMLRQQVEELPTAVPMEAWCSLHIDGAVIRLALDHDPSELLRVAAATPRDVCLGAAAGWMAWAPFQAAWAEARFGLAAQSAVRIVLDARGGAWSIDGVPIPGLGSTNLTLRPGLHRFERWSADGVLIWRVEELRPAERLAIWVDGSRIEIETATETSEDPPIQIPVLPRSHQPALITYVPPDPPPVRAALSLSGYALSWHGAPALGFSLQGAAIVKRWKRPVLAIGLAHDQTWTDGSLHLIGPISVSVVLRERAIVALHGSAESRFRPFGELSLGLLLFQAPLVESAFGGELRITDSLRLRASGSVGTSVWAEGVSGLDTTFGLGLATWL